MNLRCSRLLECSLKKTHHLWQIDTLFGQATKLWLPTEFLFFNLHGGKFVRAFFLRNHVPHQCMKNKGNE